MIALLEYLHRCFIRSYRYGAPTFIYLAILLLVYTTGSNPVMDSYAFSSSMLFVTAAAIGCLMIDVEAANQEMATLTHARSLVRLSAAKLLYAWLFASALGLFAVLYPALLGRFDRLPGFEELGIGLLYHIALAGLGVSLAGWFSAKLFESRFYAMLALCAWIALAFGSRGIAGALPDSLDWLTVLLPPVHPALHALTFYAELSSGAKWLPISAALLYAGVSAGLMLAALHKRRLDYPGGE
ncbi:hypothetical protein QWJ34_05105 [Saccharibacillus sp. CPCC 101409]|uniref:hypothetical protein n=1 Tax=Saccharibacillus sp. CPCC 101409 TaxID=3058041 RepID=UPI002670EB2B|nr:hypothetical protein [Saccharibacillus sp. CPCC 101409]MDO3409133.1 hypothetical protein [Saccharibacillus sp. CPCC 101409]